MAVADITSPSEEIQETSSPSSGWGRRLLIAIPYIWLLIFFLAPFVIVLKISLSDVILARPPYFPNFDISEGWQGLLAMLQAFDLENYVWLTEDTLYLNSYLSSLRIASISTLLTLAIGYPIAYAMAKAPKEWRATLLMLVILPFWTSFLIRVYAWIGILKKEGFLNYFLLWTGIIDEPLMILNTDTAIYIGIVYSYLPFMVLPLYAVLEKLDISLLEAATDLGCSPLKAFWVITLPLSLSGVWAGCFLVFIPAVGEFVIPDILGGSSTIMIGKTLWVEFFSNRDWPVASAVAILLLLMLILPIILFQKQQEKQAEASQ
ncbi:Putrescine transport system permease protein PotH [Pseudovibrio sp. Ad13]|uniref:ABC transporter permease subunit n=1 Tax=unclassified Pseudovibrio TaxID=2627060 RepID=UPI0007B262F7|nr:MULTISPECIES: ABC transporter permease subunit [unclassified Pseudovibrio]KZK82354.1 Putrescine transport system permease protein PotH [Pseudovibrio sp. Ad13]KZL02135.1 Putrescine transport system permease protein PotH [Pseudovibrio sp. Ad5]KZL18606.1 Putrescine transport system permease protein PotH [Pseudovibrio sp. WM33]